MTFREIGLSETIIQALAKENITIPTEVQVRAIPEALNGHDLIVQSETGSGKTLAYLAPLFERLDSAKHEMQAIVLVPTHELAIQIKNVAELLARDSGIPLQCAIIIGQVSLDRQIEKLREKPQIIVGTAGRIYELIQKKKITAHTIHNIVLDEADRLLDKNNIDSVKMVIKTTLRDRQLWAFSATMQSIAVKAATELMKEPTIIQSKESEAVVPVTIEHISIFADQRDKIEALSKLIRIITPKKAIVFINNKLDMEIAQEKLLFHGIKSALIHGENQKNQRKTVMDDFISGRIPVLLASDLAARGLHIEGVTHIFNVSIPEKPQDYLHRVGRTGRNGQKGTAVSLVSKEELPLLKVFEGQLKIKITAMKMFQDKIINIKEFERKGVN